MPNSAITEYTFELTPPSLADNTADIDRLRRNLERNHGLTGLIAPGELLQPLSDALRQDDWRGRAVVEAADSGPVLIGLASHQLHPYSLPRPLPDLDREPQPAPDGGPVYGLALDLGTTGLVMELVDLSDGEAVGRTNLVNPQVEVGADILTRIHACRGDGLTRLQGLIASGINQGLAQLTDRAGITADRVVALAAAGNTTMTHLLLGLNPHYICREPYIPVINRPDPIRSELLGLNLAPGSPVYCLPSIGSYFGGDLIAGLIASGLTDDAEVRLLVDVGTNAEVVVGNQDWLMACAGAAGPALEGGVAKMGSAAGPGVIERVRVDPVSLEPELSVIGGGEPRGICGSGLIDLVAQLFLAGVIDIQAKIRRYDHPRLILTEDGPAYRLALTDTADIVFSQVDLDVLLRSKAAMYTILVTLLKQVGLEFGDLAEILVAGTFGQHIDPRQAITIGLMPDLPLERYRSVGNSSLDGARLALISAGARARAIEIGGQITYLELNVNQEFMNRFSAAKFIPHTDRGRFPSVPEPYKRPEPLLD